MTFGYDADVVRVVDVASSNTLRDHGKSVANELAVRRMKTKTKHRPLILVAHSLGGLVCEQALLVYDRSVESYLRATLEAVHGIIFLGTLHAGSDLAKWGNLMTGMSKYFRRTNSDIMRTFRPNSEMLANLQQEFHNMVDCCRKSGRPDLKIFCFYEDLGITGLGEVCLKSR
jgi:pimeloyl-ACP methyl ester carboxylesterase